jgi:peptidoglycan/LPS O-acetylase OafA/YrhL
LPDCSLGLEMQFYAIFPFAVLLARKAGWLSAAVLIAMTSVTMAMLLDRLAINFPMPSFLALKMHLFLAGMLIAAAIDNGKAPYFLLAILLVMIPIGGTRISFILPFAAQY